MSKNLLFAANYPQSVKKAWNVYGYTVYNIQECLNRISNDSVAKEKLQYYKDKYNIQMLFSFNYTPALGEACFQLGIEYISWGLDCPHAPLWAKSSRYETNYLFVFDYQQYQQILSRGLNNVYYLPICADEESFWKTIKEDNYKSKDKYGSDVAFVGNLYNDSEHNLYDAIKFNSDYLKGYLESMMELQRKIWGVDLIGEAISEHTWNLLRQNVRWDLGDRYEDSVYEVMICNVIGQKLAQLERREVCEYLASHFEFALYTDSNTEFCPEIKNRGHADYLQEMPLIFHYSKINIHITLRTITSGMSLRVLDVLACEGFLLTNYQPEIAEYFVDGEEVVMYTDFADMYEKITYYLEHEEERKRIAHAGYLKVKEYFNYTKGIGQIINILENKE